jgi:hypothetical protein
LSNSSSLAAGSWRADATNDAALGRVRPTESPAPVSIDHNRPSSLPIRPSARISRLTLREAQTAARPSRRDDSCMYVAMIVAFWIQDAKLSTCRPQAAARRRLPDPWASNQGHIRMNLEYEADEQAPLSQVEEHSAALSSG